MLLTETWWLRLYDTIMLLTETWWLRLYDNMLLTETWWLSLYDTIMFWQRPGDWDCMILCCWQRPGDWDCMILCCWQRPGCQELSGVLEKWTETGEDWGFWAREGYLQEWLLQEGRRRVAPGALDVSRVPRGWSLHNTVRRLVRHFRNSYLPILYMYMYVYIYIYIYNIYIIYIYIYI